MYIYMRLILLTVLCMLMHLYAEHKGVPAGCVCMAAGVCVCDWLLYFLSCSEQSGLSLCRRLPGIIM